MFIFISIIILLCIYMIIRTFCVWKYNMNIIDNEYEELKKLIKNKEYDKSLLKFNKIYNLPPFEYMVNKFWVWPLSKFEKDM